MKKFISVVVMSVLNLIFSISGVAGDCKHVYTIGAYDEGFAKHAAITKLGSIPASEITANIPKSFLEKDGSYGGGEAFCSIQQACRALRNQLKTSILPKNENWRIYLLDANWKSDVYELHPNDFRIKRTVNVFKLVKKNCAR